MPMCIDGIPCPCATKCWNVSCARFFGRAEDLPPSGPPDDDLDKRPIVEDYDDCDGVVLDESGFSAGAAVGGVEGFAAAGLRVLRETRERAARGEGCGPSIPPWYRSAGEVGHADPDGTVYAVGIDLGVPAPASVMLAIRNEDGSVVFEEAPPGTSFFGALWPPDPVTNPPIVKRS